MNNNLNKIMNFHNKQVDSSIIDIQQVRKLVEYLLDAIENNIDGDVVELGCYVGESSKYLMKTLLETNSNKKLYVYDSFEGLPDLSKWEVNTGWRPRTLVTSEDVLTSNFIENNLPTPIITKGWFCDIPEDRLPEKISFAFLDGDFYDSIYDSLVKVYDRVVDGGYIFFHDYKRNDLPGVEAAIKDFFEARGIENTVVEVITQVGGYKKNSKIVKIENVSVNTNNNTTTLVTGLWNIGRDNLQEGWSRSFQHYLDKFQQLLQVDVNMIIFGDEELEKFVLNNRRSENTQFVRRELSWFKNNDFYNKIQNIRTNPDWYNQVGWLSESTQAKLEMYNPLVMSKVYLLHDAKILDKFDSEYMFWIDAGLTNTIHPGYFTHDKVLDKLPKLVKNFHFVCFPYETNSEIHGFKYQELCELAGKPVNMVARAGFFGGKKDVISEINTIYYELMNETLSNGLMGTEESLFTIMTYKYPNLITYSEIEGNGLMGKFFEDLKDMTVEVKSEVSKNVVINNLDTSKVGLYVITFNSPKQLEVLIQSMLDYDKDFIEKPRKFLLDNSTDLSTTPRYIELCEQYGFEHIKKDNIGIVGGRVFVAEHFNETDLDCYWWFEDDMAFYPKKGEVCRNGFPRFVDNLYQKSLDILDKENFDFLKLNFSEFFGDNSVQWSWYNVPQDFRQKHWPNNPKLPVQGLDPNSPKTKFNEIHIHKGLPYVTGEVYLSNWPIVFTKEGNYKCYLETKWAHPFEQTLMSYSYQETVKGKINPGLLLLTPTEHNRFDHYDGSLRKES
jgi:O-methyltransferase